jgi:hypothetical protein
LLKFPVWEAIVLFKLLMLPNIPLAAELMLLLIVVALYTPELSTFDVTMFV